MAETTVKSFRLLNVGTGGQGVIRATEILGWAAVNAGIQVRTAETHGMAQRGGSVLCYMGFGEINGPIFPRGSADVILSFEELEALRSIDYANSKTLLLISKTRLIPPGLFINKNLKYPTEEEILENLKKVTPHIYLVDALDIAVKSGEPRAENVVMLAFLFATGKLPFSREKLLESILQFVPVKARAANEKAFDLALEEAKKMMAEKK